MRERKKKNRKKKHRERREIVSRKGMFLELVLQKNVSQVDLFIFCCDKILPPSKCYLTKEQNNNRILDNTNCPMFFSGEKLC